MSEEMTEGPYASAADKVAKAHRDAVAQAKAEIEKAKSDSLRKLSR
jgi:hypothetical protein